MSKTLKDRLDYLIALVSEFAATHHMSLQQAYLYLQQYKGLDLEEIKYHHVTMQYFFGTERALTLLERR